ncbi:MAG: NUDIX hydrolase [Microscillaceae bacterium]|nr:NUDIX hydrolase [Microscillaceae bacterium]
MNKLDTLQTLENYSPWDTEDTAFKIRCLELVHNYADFYKRSLEIGHLTGSAWIVNADRNKIVLVHHLKLGRWLQPGGHTEEGDPSIFHAALREAREETGLQSIRALSDRIYDMDIHLIPAWGSTPAHEHYDIRYIFEADEHETLQLSAESKALRWFSPDEIRAMTQERSLLRMLEKMEDF